MATTSPSFYGMLCIAKVSPSATPPASLPEIHLNIWEKKESVFLDIGLMVDVSEPASHFEFFFPWPLEAGQSPVQDLSATISTPMAVPAIFNESWSITQQAMNRGAVVSDSSATAALFAIVDIDGAIDVRPHGKDANALAIDIGALRTKSQLVSQAATKMYVRFRVSHVPKSFYCVGIAQKDKNWVSSWQSTEIIDFRLNVRRGVPLGLERSIGRFVEFSKVHLFLMRGRDQDIVFEDALFKACRSLEDENFWAGYSSQSANAVKQSIGYQWSAKADAVTGKPVKEFGILARFKKVEFGIRKFLIYALLLGALGNALWDGIKWGAEGVYTAWTGRLAISDTTDTNADGRGAK